MSDAPSSSPPPSSTTPSSPAASPAAGRSGTEERRAAASLLSSVVLFAAMALFARTLAPAISGGQIAVVRFATGVLVVLGAWLVWRVDLRPRRWGWLLARGVFGGLAVLLYFSAIAHVGVGLATLLNYTAPAWAAAFGWLLLGERPRRAALLALAVTLGGVCLVVGWEGEGLGGGVWELAGALSAVCSALATTSIRAVRRGAPGGGAVESSWTVFASFTSLGLVATAPTVLPPWGRWVTPTAAQWALLMAVALSSVGAQLVMTRAFRHLTATSVGIIFQLVVVLTMAGGVLFFGETLTPRAALGSLVTMAGVVGLILSERY
jgi:drug/metabolite transporter (DMT)-like permease